MHETRNDLQESSRKGIVRLLNNSLAEGIDLQLQAKHAHRNVKGANFVGLHEPFDRIADATREYVDLIAEGGVAEGTQQTVSRRSKLPKYSARLCSEAAMPDLKERAPVRESSRRLAGLFGKE